jgi:hypothetical protein
MKRHVRYYCNKTVGIKMLLQLAAQITIKMNLNLPLVSAVGWIEGPLFVRQRLELDQ